MQIVVRLGRLVCPTYCCRQTFPEQIPGVLERYQRRTPRLTAQVGAIARELASRGTARLLSTLARIRIPEQSSAPNRADLVIQRALSPRMFDQFGTLEARRSGTDVQAMIRPSPGLRNTSARDTRQPAALSPRWHKATKVRGQAGPVPGWHGMTGVTPRGCHIPRSPAVLHP